MGYFLNTTNNYHRDDLQTLGWELTVCNSLEPADSPCRKALEHPGSFGDLLYNFLSKYIPLPDITKVLEIGGGMGYLMRDFLSRNPAWQATMLDISPFLLRKQKETLRNYAVQYREMDIMDAPPDLLSGFELVILNENIGDFPTLVYNTDDMGATACTATGRLKHFRNSYQLPFSPQENINIGAMEAVEKLCLAEIKYIYLSEHSCEASQPDFLQKSMASETTGNPERIALKGHNEYTIKFSYLQKMAHALGYKTIRGPIADFLQPDFNDRVQTSLRLAAPQTDEQEIFQQFIYDLFKYEYLILWKEN